MAVYIGKNKISNIYIGKTNVTKIFTNKINLSTSTPAGIQAHFLAVAGGGGGGNASDGGGGAGGLRTSYGSTSGGGSLAETPLTLAAGTQYTITVGGGGAAAIVASYARMPTTQGTQGVDSVISGTGITTVTSIGGGAGANGIYRSSADNTTVDGGSGAGGGYVASVTLVPPGTANSTQGYPGGIAGGNGGGGGGGASQAGDDSVDNGSGSPRYRSGDGGDGLAVAITGTPTTYAGGGGGSMYPNYSGNRQSSQGGAGGGGAAGISAAGWSTSGAYLGQHGGTNLGGGGGASMMENNYVPRGGNGGSGIVILRVATSTYSGTTTGSPTVTTDGADTIMTFTQSGTYTTDSDAGGGLTEADVLELNSSSFVTLGQGTSNWTYIFNTGNAFDGGYSLPSSTFCASSGNDNHVGYGTTMTFTVPTALYEFRIQTGYTKMMTMKLEYNTGSGWVTYATNLDKSTGSSLFVTIDSRTWWQVLTNNTTVFATTWRMVCITNGSNVSNEYWQELYLRGFQE